MKCVSGKILTEEGFKKGYIIYENGIIKEIGKINPPLKPEARGYIIPPPINSHTHIGDAFVRKRNVKLPRDIEKLVAPPHGLKHVLLESAERKEILEGMKEGISNMVNLGTYAFCDFREGGKNGVEVLKDALKNFRIRCIILSRPRKMEFEKDEIYKLLEISDGIGLSSISDWDYEKTHEISEITRKSGKIFAIHASERIREDIDIILDLKPNFLVHMNKATSGDLERIKDEGIPVVVCPRSNSFFRLKPNLENMKKTGVKICLGTDNAMIAEPNIYKEVAWIRRNCRIFSIEELFEMITFNPTELFNLPKKEFIEGTPAEFVVIDTKSLKPIFVSVFQADAS